MINNMNTVACQARLGLVGEEAEGPIIPALHQPFQTIQGTPETDIFVPWPLPLFQHATLMTGSGLAGDEEKTN